jgi:hypothetical protein
MSALRRFALTTLTTLTATADGRGPRARRRRQCFATGTRSPPLHRRR